MRGTLFSSDFRERSYRVRACYAVLVTFLINCSKHVCNSLRQRASFKGDQDSHVDELVVASQKREINAGVLKERTLVPYFNDADIATGMLDEPLESKKRSESGRMSQFRASSNKTKHPPGKTPQRRGKSYSKSSSGKSSGDESSESDSSNTRSSARTRNGEKQEGSSRHYQPLPSTAGNMALSPSTNKKGGKGSHGSKKHNRDPSHKSLTDMSDRSGSNGRPRKRYENENGHGNGDPSSLPSHIRHNATSSSRAAVTGDYSNIMSSSADSLTPGGQRFAGPAFTLSPTPDTLPLPTSLLIADATADKIRSNLVL